MKRGAALVVGGGVAGLTAAALLKRRHERVILVEREASCGGLLRSFVNPDGVSFDYGTHFISETGVPELDAVVLSPLGDGWNVFAANNVGTFHAGRLNAGSPFINASGLPPETYRRGLEELLSAAPAKDPSTLEAQLHGHFGRAFTGAILEPVLRKLLGAGPAELAPDAHKLFALGRLIVETPEKSRELKKSPQLDERVAFHSYAETPSSVRNYYPKQGGVGLWAEGMTRSLRESGVEVLTGESVESLRLEDGIVRSARLGQAGELEVDRLVWTAPLFQFFKAAGLPCPGKPPRLRTSVLHHLVFDRPFATDLNYVTCYDPSMKIFRATIYPNVLRRPDQAPYKCTVESFAGSPEEAEALRDAAPTELAAMGLVPPGAALLYSRMDVVREGFPVRTPEFAASAAAQGAAARAAASNASFLGKASGSAFFQDEVLRETYRAVSAPAEARL